MKFRLKLMLGMLCLLALLFGAGGSFLISLSFESSLEREKESAQESYQMILNTMSLVSTMDVLTNNKDISNIIDQLYSETNSTWSALCLSDSEMILSEKGAVEFFDVDHEEVDAGHSVISFLPDTSDEHYLQLSGAFMVDQELYYLDALLDISSVYDVRAQQQDVYRIIFVALVALCSVLASVLAWVLTRPLSKLSRASRDIASGNLASRSKIRTNDEVGKLSEDFDIMAHQVEKSVLSMQESMEQQERFMGSFAHELKTPMTAIIGYADLLRQGRLDPEEQQSAAEYIFSESARLESLSLKLLDIFVLDRRDFELTPESPAHLVEEVIVSLSHTLAKEGITIIGECEEGLCYLEPDLVKSLIINLVDNARKATGLGGTIKVVVTMIPEGCCIQVIDDGKGIPPDSLEHLAEAFYRVDKSRSRAEGGAGLGLMLCVKVAELHDGMLEVESEVHRGTCMTAELRGGRA